MLAGCNNSVDSHSQYHNLSTEGKFLAPKFEFGESNGMSLEGDCHEAEVTPNLELLFIFGLSLEGVCQELYTQFH